MESDVSTIISDSEPEREIERAGLSQASAVPSSSAASDGPLVGNEYFARRMREAAKLEREKAKAEERAGRSSSGKKKDAGADEDEKGEVLVLSSSSSGGEDAEPKPSTSRYFSSGSGGAKRRRVPSTTPAGEGWPSLSAFSAPAAAAAAAGPRARSGSNSSLESQPFMSALDLLRSTPTQPSDVEGAGGRGGESEADEKPKRRRGKERAKEKTKKAVGRKAPTVKKETSTAATTGKARGKAKTSRRGSAPSVEVVGEEGVSDDEDRMSVSSAASSSSSSLPAPKSWKERFQFGARSSKDSLSGSGEAEEKKPKAEPSPTGTAGTKRRKPWEEMESAFANRPRVKPPPLPSSSAAAAAKKGGSAKVKKVVKAESVSALTESDSDDAIIIIDRSPSTSTAFLPLPSASLASGSSATTAKRLKSSTLSFLPAPLALPSDDRIRALTACALCAAPWAASKSLSVRQTHLRSCAGKQLYNAPTLAFLVDEAVLRAADAAEERRRERDEGMSLFDRAVGKGEGSNPWKEVTVVGVEAKMEAGGDEFFHATKKVQEELDGQRRKIGVEKVVKVAKEIRRERATKAAAVAGAAGAVKAEEGAEGEGGEGEEGAAPAPTGRLLPDSDSARATVAQRASELLGLAGGTGLTQIPAAGLAPSLPPGDAAAPAARVEADVEAGMDDPPRPTQGFAASDLAGRWEDEGRAEVVRLPSRSSASLAGVTAGGTSAKGKGKGKEVELSSDSDEDLLPPVAGAKGKGKKTASLWSVSAGRDEDDKVVGRVVPRPHPPRSPSPPFPSRAVPSSPSPTRLVATAAAPASPGLGLSPSSAARFSTLTLTSPTRSFHSSPPRAMDLAHPYSPLSRPHRHSSSPGLPSSPTASVHRRPSSSNAPAARGRSPSLQEQSPASAAEKRMRRLGFSEHRAGGPEGEGEAGMGVWADAEADEVEAWLMEGGATSQKRKSGDEESSEEEPLASATKRRRREGRSASSVSKATPQAAPEPPSSPSPSASRTKRAITSKTKTSSTSRRRRAPSLPSSPVGDDAADNFHFPSDDSLPALARPAKKRAPAAKPAAKTAAPPPADDTAEDSDPAGMPAYATRTLAQLQKEVQRYGFRPSKEKSVMVEQLRAVWMAMNPSASTSTSVVAARASPAKAKAKGKKRAPAAAASAVEEEDQLAKEPKAKPRARKKKAAAATSDAEPEPEDTETAGEKLRKLILADVGLYCRILRYEPIHFDEFTALCKTNNVKIAQQLLMRCLDEQSITFYTQDPTNGSRRRYK
ncbi:hypothetical protein JCM10213_003181 [Rhodosporidiobolus nylandii]